jgi:hypothetical protein
MSRRRRTLPRLLPLWLAAAFLLVTGLVTTGAQELRRQIP